MPRRAKMPLRSPLICDEKLWRGSRKPLKAVGISSISFNIHFCLPNDIYDWRVCQVENGAPHSDAGSLAAYHIALCTFFGWLPAPVYSENGSLAHEPRRFLFRFYKTAEATAADGRRRQQTSGSRQAIPGEESRRGRYLGLQSRARRSAATSGSHPSARGPVCAR